MLISVEAKKKLAFKFRDFLGPLTLMLKFSVCLVSMESMVNGLYSVVGTLRIYSPLVKW